MNLITRLGLDARLRREGLVHSGTNLAVDGGVVIHIDFADLTGGATIPVYGQSEVMRELDSAAGRRGLDIIYEAEEVALHGLDTDQPQVTWRLPDARRRLPSDTPLFLTSRPPDRRALHAVAPSAASSRRYAERRG